MFVIYCLLTLFATARLWGVGVTFALNIMAQSFEYPEVAQVQMTIFGSDQGISNDRIALRMMVGRVRVQHIDWLHSGPKTQAATTPYS